MQHIAKYRAVLWIQFVQCWFWRCVFVSNALNVNFLSTLLSFFSFFWKTAQISVIPVSVTGPRQPAQCCCVTQRAGPQWWSPFSQLPLTDLLKTCLTTSILLSFTVFTAVWFGVWCVFFPLPLSFSLSCFLFSLSPSSPPSHSLQPPCLHPSLSSRERVQYECCCCACQEQMSKKYQPSERKGVREREKKRKREEAHGGRLGEP